MERYNIFHLIHKGLRACLFQTALQLQQTDFNSDEECEEAINRVREVVMLFDGHAHKEDHFILPAIAGQEPSVTALFSAEHVKDEELGKQLQERIAKIENAQSTLERQLAGNRLTEAFIDFTAFNLQHMAKEEDILNKLLWRYYTDDEIKAIGNRLSQSVEPWMQDFYAGWMLRGINNTETINWMHAIKNGMPAVVYQTLLQKASQVLPKPRFNKIIQSLEKSVAAA